MHYFGHISQQEQCGTSEAQSLCYLKSNGGTVLNKAHF